MRVLTRDLQSALTGVHVLRERAGIGIVEASGSRERSTPWKGTTLMSAGTATVARPIARAPQPLARRAWATAISYIVIYGVTFAFFAPPATSLAMSEQSGYTTATASFALLLLAALTVTFGATVFGFAVGWRVEKDLRSKRTSPRRAAVEFALLGTLLSLATAGIFLMFMAHDNPVTPSLLGAAGLALVVPGLAAALFTLPVVDHVAANNRELITTSLGALVVIGLTNYLIVGALPSFADLPQLFGL